MYKYKRGKASRQQEKETKDWLSKAKEREDAWHKSLKVNLFLFVIKRKLKRRKELDE